MDGIHDLGGLEGFGPLPLEENEPVFHMDWERRVMALQMLMFFWRRWSLDMARYSMERLPPADYLQFSYYEKWLASLVNRMVSTGLITIEEISAGGVLKDSEKRIPPVSADDWRQFVANGRTSSRVIESEARFAVGDKVVVASHMHSGHHRVPRYVRGHSGEIILCHGGHVFPDTNVAQATGEPKYLYTIKFRASDLWSEAVDSQDTICIDLWEPYLVSE